MTTDVVLRTRKLVGDAANGPALHELLHSEAGRVTEGMRDASFDTGADYSVEEFVRRLAAYEALAEPLTKAAALVAYWAKSTDDRLVPGLVGRLANAIERAGGQQPYLDLLRYPAVLVLHGAGLGAVLGQREEQLAKLLGAQAVRERDEWTAIAVALSAPATIDHRVGSTLPGLERHRTPASDHLVELMRPWLAELESDQAAFERVFDRWEYLAGLVAYDVSRQGHTRGWGAVGRFIWRGEYWKTTIDTEVPPEVAEAGSRWPLLAAGAFGGDLARLKESLEGWTGHIASVRGQRF